MFYFYETLYSLKILEKSTYGKLGDVDQLEIMTEEREMKFKNQTSVFFQLHVV